MTVQEQLDRLVEEGTLAADSTLYQAVSDYIEAGGDDVPKILEMIKRHSPDAPEEAIHNPG